MLSIFLSFRLAGRMLASLLRLHAEAAAAIFATSRFFDFRRLRWPIFFATFFAEGFRRLPRQPF
jgi:hypothetical protein